MKEDHKIRARLQWVQLYQKTGNISLERTQKTDIEEFYGLVDLKSQELPQQLQQWQEYYNCQRRHGSVNNQTP